MRIHTTYRCLAHILCTALFGWAAPVFALNGTNYQMVTYNNWEGFEIISYGDNPSGDGYDYAMPGTFDGIGAQVTDATLRIQLNHEIKNGEASISEIVLNTAGFMAAVNNVMTNGSGNTGGVLFVHSARQAYESWSDNAGMTWNPTTNASTTSFSKLCSGQSYAPNTFATGRGFSDYVYITGEEVDGGRLFALDIENHQLYQLSGITGSSSITNGGMPYDSYENAALIDTAETNHIALLLSADGDSEKMRLYVGEKGKDLNGLPSNTFLARNGLAYGSYYYLIDELPVTAGTTSTNGAFSTSPTNALSSAKFEDIDTCPGDPTRVFLNEQNFGVFTFEFDLDFSGGTFDADNSGFTLAMLAAETNGTNVLSDPDNADWCSPTTLGTNAYPEGLIFVNEDNVSGEIWMMTPDGSNQTLIASTVPADESSGILDISKLLGYNPGSILLTDILSTLQSSLNVLINPDATLAPPPVIEVFTYDAMTGESELEWVGGAGACYRITTDHNIHFTTPLPVQPGIALVGTISADLVVADDTGCAAVQLNLGMETQRFVRVESP